VFFRSRKGLFNNGGGGLHNILKQKSERIKRAYKFREHWEKRTAYLSLTQKGVDGILGKNLPSRPEKRPAIKRIGETGGSSMKERKEVLDTA